MHCVKGDMVGTALFIVHLNIYVEVINAKVTHPLILLTEHYDSLTLI